MMHVEWDLDAAEKGGYEDFMLKEIHEQPKAVRETLRGRLGEDGQIQLSELAMTPEQVAAIDRVYIIACGTSLHAGIVGQEPHRDVGAHSRARCSARASSATATRSSTRRRSCVAITQSGETADTLAGVREARERGAKVIAITNVVGSRVTRESDGVHLHPRRPGDRRRGDEDLHRADRGAHRAGAQARTGQRDALRRARCLALRGAVARFPRSSRPFCRTSAILATRRAAFVDAKSSLFLGRGFGVPVAMEGALKLKEISYIHAEAYPAGEMKHGPIALITDDMPVVFVATQGRVYEKVVSNIQEVRARGASIIAVATAGDEDILKHAEHVLPIPRRQRGALGDSGYGAAAAARVPHRQGARLQRRPAAQPRQVRDGGVAT